jgi:hypothetical protein
MCTHGLALSGGATRGLVRVSSVRRDLRADRQGAGHRDINPFGLAENTWADHTFGPADELTIYLGLRDLSQTARLGALAGIALAGHTS